MFNRLLLVVTLLFVFGINTKAQEQSVYKRVNVAGNIEYSTTPFENEQSPIKLPTISKENMDTRIDRIKGSTPQNCEGHGDIDCSQGSDVDGSVICLDGFREAVAPFRFSCLEVSLKTINLRLIDFEEEIHEISKQGLIIPKEVEFSPKSLQVVIRNMSNVEAQGVIVRIPSGRKTFVQANGPSMMKPFEVGEYEFDFSEIKKIRHSEELSKGSIRIMCQNCH